MSEYPLGFTFKLTINPYAFPSGMLSSWSVGSGKSEESGEWSSDGFQDSEFSSALVRSHSGSDMHPHSLGPGFPPNVRRRLVMARFFDGSCIQVFAAVDPWR